MKKVLVKNLQFSKNLTKKKNQQLVRKSIILKMRSKKEKATEPKLKIIIKQKLKWE